VIGLLLATAIAATTPPAEPISAQGAEKKPTLRDLPPAVQETVKAQGKDATLRGLATELMDGVTVYEVELTVRGRTRDMILDAEGKILTVEDQTTLDEIPEGARAAIQKAVGTGKLTFVEKVTQGATTFYEGHIRDGANISEVKVDADGRPVK
jgi:uncharacterized membrane protein YkoI